MRDPKPGEQIPNELLIASMQPFIGSSHYERLIKDYPDWFSDELEWRRKMGMVPKEVDDVYWVDHDQQYNEFYKDCPYRGMGILWYIDHPQEFAEYIQWVEAHSDEWKAIEKSIFNKHYGPYGLIKS